MSFDQPTIALLSKQARRAARRAERQEKTAREIHQSTDNPIIAALMTRPRPLVDPQYKLIVVFSPKSACTSVAIWFFNLIGHVRAARYYNEWPHEYRMVLYESATYGRALRDDLANYRLLRVVRDPFDRALSSFRTSLGGGYADAEITAAQPEYDRQQRRMSLWRFLDFLETEDLTNCNPHHGLQVHPIEDLVHNQRRINISREDLFSRLNEFESELHLPHTDFPNLDWIHHLAKKRQVSKMEFEGDAAMTEFDSEQARLGPWPQFSAFLTPPVRERIARLYAPDVERYGGSSSS